MSEEDRMYFRFTTAELRREVEANWSAPERLHALYFELVHRERRAARKLRESIEAHLKTFDGYFPWPSTEVRAGRGSIDSASFAVAEGVLGFMGYRVGARAADDGVTPQKRRAVLEDVYLHALPPMQSAEYMVAWGRPKTATRLKKIANAIAANTCLRKRRDGAKFAVAIKDWEADLAYLKRSFYVDVYSFKWPTTTTRAGA